MSRASYGWATSANHEVDTTMGKVRASTGIQQRGPWAGCLRLVVKHVDGTWSMIQLTRTGAVLASVNRQPTKKAASERLEAELDKLEPVSQ